MKTKSFTYFQSSWWMLNPDAKPGKAARRRATSMETSKYEKRRGRIRKRIEALKNGTTVLDTPSPCSSLGEGLDVFPGSDESPSVIAHVIIIKYFYSLREFFFLVPFFWDEGKGKKFFFLNLVTNQQVF